MLWQYDVVRIGLELHERLVFGDELHAGHSWIDCQLLLEVGHVLQRRAVGDIDRDLADLRSEPVQHLRERVTYQEVHAGENEDERDREHRGHADREVPPEALPGAIEFEFEVSINHRSIGLNDRPWQPARRRWR